MRNTNILKGLAVLLIITHNYMHWLPHCIDGNENTFAVERIGALGEYLANGGPHVFINILSHYGHYGVAIFLFLSGYGLVKKYEASPDAHKQSWWRFLVCHAWKLWKLMVPAVAIFVLIELVRGTWDRPPSSLVPLLGFYSNLLPQRDFILGPWWWFGLMMQFYLLWRIVLYHRGKIVLYGLMAVCLAVQIGFAWIERGSLQDHHTITSYLHYNFPPSMLAFGLGVAHARYHLAWLRQWWTPVVGLILVILGSFNAGIWCISPMGAVMIALAFTTRRWQRHPKHIIYLDLNNILCFLGSISAWLFALHPILRQYTIKIALWGNDWLIYISTLIYIIACILLAWLFTLANGKKPTHLHNKHISL